MRNRLAADVNPGQTPPLLCLSLPEAVDNGHNDTRPTLLRATQTAHKDACRQAPPSFPMNDGRAGNTLVALSNQLNIFMTRPSWLPELDCPAITCVVHTRPHKKSVRSISSSSFVAPLASFQNEVQCVFHFQSVVQTQQQQQQCFFPRQSAALRATFPSGGSSTFASISTGPTVRPTGPSKSDNTLAHTSHRPQ